MSLLLRLGAAPAVAVAPVFSASERSIPTVARVMALVAATTSYAEHSFITPPARIPQQFAASPERFTQARPAHQHQFGGFSFLQIAYTPTTWWASASPELFTQPRPVHQYGGFSFLQIAYTPSTWWSNPSPEGLVKPRPAHHHQYGGFPFLQIAYTPSTWWASASPERFARKAVAPYSEPTGGIVNAPVVTPTPTPTTWWSNPSPERFVRPRPAHQHQYGGFPFLQIAYTPSAWWSNPSPERFISPRPVHHHQYGGFSFLQIAYTPSVWWASASPDSFKQARPAHQHQYGGFSFLQVSPNVSWASASPEKFSKREIAPYSEATGGVAHAPLVTQTPTNWSFSQCADPIGTLRTRISAESFIASLPVITLGWALKSQELIWRVPHVVPEFSGAIPLSTVATPSIWWASPSPHQGKSPSWLVVDRFSSFVGIPILHFLLTADQLMKNEVIRVRVVWNNDTITQGKSSGPDFTGDEVL